MKTELGEEFLIARGGPFYQLQNQMGLIHENALNSVRRSIIVIFLTAIVPAVLAALTVSVDNAVALLATPEFFTRFILFVAICFQMERLTETRLQEYLTRFDNSGLLDDARKKAAADAIARALSLRNMTLAEVVILTLAAAFSVGGLYLHTGEDRGDLLMTLVDGERQLSAAGMWLLSVSNTIFWFLVLRWIWRIVIWGMLMRWLAGLDMRLVVTHPDRVGGVGFIGSYPNTFAPFIFGISSVVAASVYRMLGNQQMEVSTYSTIMTIWLAIVLVAFVVPLLAFSTPLAKLREDTLTELDRLDTAKQRTKEQDLFAKNLYGPQDKAPKEETDIPDGSDFRKAANSLRMSPFSRKALLPLSAAALVPLLIAGATQLPFKDLLKVLKSLLIL